MSLNDYEYLYSNYTDEPALVRKVSSLANQFSKLVINQEKVKDVPDFASLILDNFYPIYDINDGHLIIPGATEKTVGGNISIPIIDKFLPIGLNT